MSAKIKILLLWILGGRWVGTRGCPLCLSSIACG